MARAAGGSNSAAGASAMSSAAVAGSGSGSGGAGASTRQDADEDASVPMSSSTEMDSLKAQFCHAGACKVTLAAGYELDLKADWTACRGRADQQPLGADTTGVMLWPTSLQDLVIPLADSGWYCKLPAANGNRNGCVINASQTSRELYIWGPIETACTYTWGRTPSGIDATLGPGCGMCELAVHARENSGEYAFNMGADSDCGCPKISFAAVPAKMQP
jgi:hypothetical protein